MFIALCINLKIKSTHTKYQCIQPAFEIALQFVNKGKGKVNKKQNYFDFCKYIDTDLT